MKKMTAAMAALGVVAGLGAAALPLSSYAAETTVPVTAIIDSTLSISTSAEEVKISNVVPGGVVASEDLTVTVKTNDADASTNSYKLTIKDSDAVTALVTADGKNNIPAGVPTDNGAASAWGWATVNTTTGAASAYKGVTVAEQTINATAPLTDGAGSIVLRFGVNAKDGQAAGTYTGGVILTATANN